MILSGVTLFEKVGIFQDLSGLNFLVMMIKISLADRYFIKFPLLELIMSHPIWKIGLFTKLSKDHKAECIECKKAGRTKCEFELSQLECQVAGHTNELQTPRPRILSKISSTSGATKSNKVDSQ
jgi:hypothetical protein